ncbi:unnamed protein product, partial [Rotaria magnacalcarata]
MSNKLFINRLSSLISFGKRAMIINSDFDLANKMKLFNDNNQYQKSLELFDKYKKNNLELCSNFIITQALKACAQLGDIRRGTTIHNRIESHIKDDTYILSALISFYIKSDDLKNAESLFIASKNISLSMYAALMKGYIKSNQPNKALDLFNKIDSPDQVIIILLFNACALLGTNEALNLVKRASKEIPKSFYSNPRLLTSLLDALIKCGDIKHAELLFGRLRTRTLSMYNAIMNGFNKEKNPSKTLDLFHQMKISGLEPNFITYTCLIKALSLIGDYSVAQSLIGQIPDSVLVDNQIHNALIDMWGKTGCVNRAKEIFKKIHQPDQIGYATMINCYGLNGMGTQAIELYRQISLELTNESVNVSVLNACSHSGLVDQARCIFRNIHMKSERIYTTMIDCLARASCFDEVQQLIDEYERSHSPVAPMYMAWLSGARNIKNSPMAQQVYDQMKKLFPDLTDSLTSASILLANAYGSSGDIDKATDIQTQLYQSGAKKKVGLSCTVVDGEIYEFRAHGQSHPRSSEIHAEVEKMSQQLIEHGHKYDSSWITRPLNKGE